MSEILLSDPCCVVGLLVLGFFGVGWVVMAAVRKAGCAPRRGAVSRPPLQSEPTADRQVPTEKRGADWKGASGTSGGAR